MKSTSLLDVYKLNRKVLGITMPVFAVLWVIAAVIVWVVLPEIWWIGLVFLAMSILTLLIYIFIRKFINKKIKELEVVDSKITTNNF